MSGNFGASRVWAEGDLSSPPSAASASARFVDGVDALRIEGEMVLDGGDARQGVLVSPHCVFRHLTIHHDGEVARITLVGAMAGVGRAPQKAHVGILARKIFHLGMMRLLEIE